MMIHRSFALVGGAERVIIDKANYLSSISGYQILKGIELEKQSKEV